jgi:hypothetical protein
LLTIRLGRVAVLTSNHSQNQVTGTDETLTCKYY